MKRIGEKRTEDQLILRRDAMVKRCDVKVGRRHLRNEQREILEKERLSRAQEAADLKQREIEIAHGLAAELSRRKNEETKRALKLRGVKPSVKLSSSCALDEARTRVIEEKVRLEANQAELLILWHKDETNRKLQQAEEEERRRNLCIDLQTQMANNRRRIEEERTKEKNWDREIIEETMRKIREEDTEMKKRKDDNAFLLREEMAASLAARETWEKKYKEALRSEDERITRIITEKETLGKKMIDKETEFRAAKEAAINKVARKLLDDVHKRKEREEISNELYQEEQRSKWAREPARIALRKQCAIVESLKEMARQQEAIAERKAKDDAINAAFERHLAEEREKDIEKERKRDDTRRTRNIQYGEELKETIINNRISHAMNILERQPEIRVYDQDVNESATTSAEEPNGRSDNRIARKISEETSVMSDS